MATRGRKPKPTAIRVLEGMRGHRPLPEGEPIVPESAKGTGAVECPSWLSKDAKKEWKRLADTLIEMGTLTSCDISAFAGYCQAYADWKEATLFVRKNGATLQTPSGYIQQVPQVTMARHALQDMKQFAVELGLTPSSRTRINNGTGASKDLESDPMESLLKEKWA